MCLALVAIDAHPRYALVIAANRDEFHARATAPAAWWPDGFLAGKDLAAGGTWLGMTRGGRFALLTNVRDPARHDPAAPSRGSLVPRVLVARAGVLRALELANHGGERHNGYNIIAGDSREAGWMSNRTDALRPIGRGVYGLSNAALDVAWPKVVRTKAALAAWIARGDAGFDAVFEALADRTLAADAALPSTGVPLDRERMLSAAFIVSDRYGTRSSTVVGIDREGTATFIERSFDPDGKAIGEVRERFSIDAG
jgi:uncharacterized protein with NRDE domain